MVVPKSFHAFEAQKQPRRLNHLFPEGKAWAIVSAGSGGFHEDWHNYYSIHVQALCISGQDHQSQPQMFLAVCR